MMSGYYSNWKTSSSTPISIVESMMNQYSIHEGLLFEMKGRIAANHSATPSYIRANSRMRSVFSYSPKLNFDVQLNEGEECMSMKVGAFNGYVKIL